ncbi:MAG: class I SAM-dependent methyltransferase [Ramlibacter sp.]
MNLAEKHFLRSLIEQAAAPYRSSSHYAWRFARGKLGGDPAFAAVLALGLLSGRQRVLDIGSGQGLLTAWLLAAQHSSQQGQWPEEWPPAPAPATVHGIELMQHDVDRANEALKTPVQAGRASFAAADMREADFDRADAVVILDVLHYVSIADQDRVLQRVRAALGPGGVLLLRIGDAAGGLRFMTSYWVDAVVTTLRGHRMTRLHCRTLAQWQEALRTLGFDVQVQPMSQGTPFANVMLVARLR